MILNSLFFLIFVYLRRKYNETQTPSIVEHKPRQPDDSYGNPTYVAPDNYAEIGMFTQKPQTTNENTYDDFGELGMTTYTLRMHA